MASVVIKSITAGESVTDAELPNDDLRELVHLLKLVADDTRIRILYFLRRESELNVQAICERLSQTQPAVSHHLALLRADHLIEMRREGKHNYYHLAPARLRELAELMDDCLPPGSAE
ncbi:MAG: metalloregulator ArsR/SmtB family transcription factor [Pirellulaceae bacterium]|jgi:ArsR family transcriptional regulator|nr:metalloregulator ArsR/SmtB family transcription factor [Pirellulaceae bacterium]MDP7019843.1 metalloregulator ArsR/SmtB family transcription factor [Pirellulaceae bacterium]